MGFFDDLLKVALPAVIGFATGGPAGAIAGGIGGLIAPDAPEPSKIASTTPSSTSLTLPSRAAVQAAAPGGIGTALSSIALGGLPQAILGASAVLSPAAAAAAVTGGKNVVVTTVTTFNAAGQAIKQKQLAGRPFLMNKDIVTAKRVFRTIQKASGRLPRRTVKEGKQKQLTDAVMDKALSNVITDHHGHHGDKC